ncbi:hypothetical protein ACSMXN_23875 [Jatrophihabitans sp. DSM 45814]
MNNESSPALEPTAQFASEGAPGGQPPIAQLPVDQQAVGVSPAGRALEQVPPVPRPKTVDWALWAIVARCVFVIGFSLSLYTAKSDLIRGIRDSDQAKGWTDAQILHQYHNVVRSNIVVAVLGSVIVLILAKYIRSGRNWARWLFAVLVVFPFSPLSDVVRILNVAIDVPILVRILSLLTGLSALAAVVLLFIKPSAPYFRKPVTAGAPATATVGPGAPFAVFSSLLKPRAVRPSPPAEEPPGQQGQTPATRPLARSKVRGPAGNATNDSDSSERVASPPSKRNSARAKSRKAPTE